MPAPPVRQFSFTDWQVNNPTAPPPGDRLDSEVDQSNNAIASVITWASVTLNTDGSLRDGSVDSSQLVSGLFDDVAQSIMATVQPLLDQTLAASGAALSSAQTASNAADNALSSQILAAGSAGAAAAAVTTVQAAVNTAQAAVDMAMNAANAGANAADTAIGAQGQSGLYANLAGAWAEYMPDNIPPNILAVMGITGNHWSSRWWATQAQDGATQALADLQALFDTLKAQLLAELSQFYMGAFPSDPDATGKPVGCLYWNTANGVMMVWTGDTWVRVVSPVAGIANSYVFRPAAGTFVLSGLDINGNLLSINIATDSVALWRNGLRLLLGQDFTVQDNQVTLTQPSLAGATYAVDVTEPIAVQPGAATAKLYIGDWVINGVNVTFPLHDPGLVTITPAQSTDLFVSLNGVYLDPGVDFTVSGSMITFAVPPEPDGNFFGVVGVPGGGP
jgi:hypothetical protein